MSQVLRALKRRGKQFIEPTERQCLYWLRVLGRDVFDGFLPAPAAVRLETKEGWAAACAFPSRDTWELELRCVPMPFEDFIELLAHEAVHAMLHCRDHLFFYTGHGPAFMAYRPTLAAHGIELKKEFHGA